MAYKLNLLNTCVLFLSTLRPGYGLDTYYKKVSTNPHMLSGLQIINSFPATNRVECAHRCTLKTGCVGFVIGTSECVLVEAQSLGQKPFVYQDDQVVYIKESAELTLLVYRVPEEINQDATILYESQTSSPPVEVKEGADFAARPGKVYKNPILDSWNSFSVSKVVVAFVSVGGDLLNVTFDAKDATDKYNWMKSTNILSSPWSDLNNQAQTVYFGVFGGPKRVKRRFYMMKNHDGCRKDVGWFQVIYIPGDTCTGTWPIGFSGNLLILHSTLSTSVIWSTNKDFSAASDMVLLIVVSI